MESKFRLMTDEQLSNAHDKLQSSFYRDSLVPILQTREIGLKDRLYTASSHEDAERIRGRIDELKFLARLPDQVTAEILRRQTQQKP